MPRHVPLWRPSMRQRLAAVSRRYPRVTSFARFCVLALAEINPDNTNEIKDNFSESEAIAGWLSPKPIDRGIRNTNMDLRLFEDGLGRPDLYARETCDAERRYYNQQNENRTRQLYVIPLEKRELKYKKPKSKKGRPRTLPDNATEIVIYDVLKIVRGGQMVAGLQRHNDDGIAGLTETNDRLEDSRNVRAVDRATEQLVEEIRVTGQ